MISDELRATLQEKMEGCGLFESEDENGHHHERKPSIITAAASGLVNFLLMFGMSCAYGIIIFSDDHHRMHVPLAIKMNLSTGFLIGLLCAVCSKVPVAIGGPDINPAVFLGLFVEAMAPEIASELRLAYPSTSSTRRLAEDVASAASACYEAPTSADFCTGQHALLCAAECGDYHDQLTATTTFAIAASTFVMGVVYFAMGSLKLTRYMAYVPTTIMEAFLACVGYKVFAEAVKQASYMPSQFVPAGIIGIGMYFVKAKHIGNPAIMMPLGFLVPLAAFYVGIYSVGSNIDEIREDGLMYDVVENVNFWEIWTSSIGKPESINFNAWTRTLPDLAIMIIVVTLDCVLKVSSTDTKMPVHVDKDYEVRMHGINNLLTAPTGSAVGYMQLKFNVINYGIIGNVTDRKAGIIYSLLMAVCYFGTIEPFNYMPRFFISSLLFFAGSGFVAENLWGSRGTNSLLEWFEIVLIVITFILSGQLVIAVAVGGVICFITFILKYAKISVMDGVPQRGGDCKVVERRGPLMQRSIRNITDNWLLVVRLKGYIFFASADSLSAHVNKHIQEQEEAQMPEYSRLKYLVLDCSLLDGVDASAAKSMKRLVANAGKHGVRVVWTHLTPAFAAELRMRGVLAKNSKDVFSDIEEVVMQVEQGATRYLQDMEKKWVSLHPAFDRMRKITQAQFNFEPFTQVFLSPVYRIGCPWQYCSPVKLHALSTLLFSPGQSDGYVYLVHSGAVALFEELPAPGQKWGAPVAIYKQGWFLNREVLMKAPSRYYAVAIEDGEALCWSQDQWWRMACERPLMMSEILKCIMKQQARDSNSFDVQMHDTVPLEGLSDDAVWDLVHIDLEKRRHSGVSMQSSQLSQLSKLGLPPPSLPEELQARLTAMETAQALEGHGFYKAGASEAEETVLPQLPESLKADVEAAFRSYAWLPASYGEEAILQAKDVASAVMYAGLFHCPEVYDDSKQAEVAMTHSQFHDFCHKAYMHPMTRSKVEIARKLFGLPASSSTDAAAAAVADTSVTLSAREFQRVLRQVIPGVSAEMADAYFMAFQPAGRGLSSQLNFQTFLGIMALLIRLHEPYWELLQGCREVVGFQRCHANLELTHTSVVRASEKRAELSGGQALSKSEAEAMLWSSDWRFCGQGGGHVLGFPEFASAITATFNRSAGSLPAPVANQGVDIEEDGVLACPSKTELVTDANWDVLLNEGATSAPDLATSKESPSRHLADLVSPKPPSPEGNLDDVLNKRLQSGETSASEPPAPARRALEGIVACLVLVSTLALVVEPIVSGEDDDQTEGEERIWLIVEACITAFLSVEFAMRAALVLRRGFAASGHTVVGLIMEAIATVPLYMELLAEPFGEGLIYDGLKDGAALFRVVRMARVSRFATSTTLAAPVATMLVVVWGIYVKHSFSGK